MREPTSFAICALILIGGLVTVEGNFARASDDDDAFQASGRASSAAVATDKTNRHNFVGARDEGRLEIQASLSQPTRNADGSSVILDEADEPVTAPATD